MSRDDLVYCIVTHVTCRGNINNTLFIEYELLVILALWRSKNLLRTITISVYGPIKCSLLSTQLEVPNIKGVYFPPWQAIPNCRFTVAEWLTNLTATLEVMGSRPSLSDISEIYFLESIQSLAQRDLKWSV